MVGLFGIKDPVAKEVWNKKKLFRKKIKQKEYDFALKIGSEILKKMPHENDILFVMGGIYYRKNKHKTALSYFEKSLEIGQFDTEVMILKANSHYKLGHLKKAIECCNKIKELEPKNKEVEELLSKIQNVK